jgi:hypothetical protein
MPNLRFDLEQEVRKFLQNEFDNGTRKKVYYDIDMPSVLGVSDTGENYNFEQDCLISDFLGLPSQFVNGRVVDLKDDLLNLLSGHAKVKCTNPTEFARRILEGVKHIRVDRFLAKI